MNQTDARRIIKAPGVLTQDLDGEAVLLNLENGQYYGLDDVGYRMYTVLVTSQSVAEALEKLEAEYDAELECLRADLEKLLDDLLENGLVVVCQEADGKS